MHRVKLVDVKIGERFREDYGNIEELKTSLATYGLLQPIVLDRDLNLIAGGRRVRAATELKWDEIDASFRDEVDPLTARELELEENIRRKELTWTERCALVSEIDKLKREKYGSAIPGRPEEVATVLGTGWDQNQTALALDMSQSTVSRDLAVARMIEIMPDLAEETDRTNAIKRFDRQLETMERELAVRRSKHVQTDFVLGDVREAIKSVPDKSVDLIIMDPPYGIDLESQNDGTEIHFDDSPESAFGLFNAILRDLRRILKDDGHLYCFAGLKPVVYGREFIPAYWAMMRSLEADGFRPDPIPLVWVKSTSGLCDFEHRYAFAYEPIIFCQGRRIARKHVNVFTYDSVSSAERTNIAEKPLALLRELIELSTQPGEMVYDPCAGSANTLLAAKLSGRRFGGCELDQDQWNVGVLKLTTESEAPAFGESNDSNILDTGRAMLDRLRAEPLPDYIRDSLTKEDLG